MKASHKKYKYTAEQLAEILYDRMFTKWYSGNDKIFQNGVWFVCYRNIKDAKQFILEKLRAGADIRTGYTCSYIRGARNYYVFEVGFQ